MAELRGFVKPGDRFSLFAISIDPAPKVRELIAKIEKDGKGKVDFPLLSDPGHKTIDSYGLYDPAYAGQEFDGIPHPAVYVLDKDRKVVWAKVEMDYKKRPSVTDIRTALTPLLK